MPDSPVRAFISYSHDSEVHRARVLDLAQRLRDDGADCRIDQFVNGCPAEGWPRWSARQIQDADIVLLVWTEVYSRRCRGEGDPETGLGATWEGALIDQALYESRGRNDKYVSVVMDNEDIPHIPAPFRRFTHYVLMREYEPLFRHVTGQPETMPRALGPKRVLPPVAPDSGSVDDSEAVPPGLVSNPPRPVIVSSGPGGDGAGGGTGGAGGQTTLILSDGCLGPGTYTSGSGGHAVGPGSRGGDGGPSTIQTADVVASETHPRRSGPPRSVSTREQARAILEEYG